MPRSPNERNLSADISSDLFNQVEDFLESHNKVTKRQFITAIVQLFLALPEQSQAMLLFCPPDSKNFRSVINSLTEGKVLSKRTDEVVEVLMEKLSTGSDGDEIKLCQQILKKLGKPYAIPSSRGRGKSV